MRVLYFHQYFCTPEGNSGIRSYGMAKHIVDSGNKVTMVFSESPRLKSPITIPYNNGMRRGQYEGIDLIEFNLKYNNKLSLFKRALVFFKFSLRSIKLVFSEDYDIVYATSTPLTAGIPGIIMKLFGKKKPFVFEVRDLWPELPREMGVVKNKFVLWGMGVLESLSYNLADACVALSPGIEKGIRKVLKKKDKPVYLIPNGCDLDIFTPGRHSKDIIPGAKEDDFLAVFTGAHGLANGLEAAINAAAVLKKSDKGKNIKLVFIGDGALKAKLVKRAQDEGLDNCVFLSPVPKKELVNYLKACDVGLMLLANIPAFYFGTSPNKFFDYISMGMPILNNYPGWLAEMITEYNLGIAVEPDNPEAFANALIKLSEDKSKLEEMRINSRKLAEEKFDRLKLADKLNEVLEKTVSVFNKKK
ncbi:MAG: glycosyltransferase family 4 protein [Bacteroidetes bacterium]|nr:glycosyltransferase family 4 protein [Bacteroidota bacterium]